MEDLCASMKRCSTASPKDFNFDTLWDCLPQSQKRESCRKQLPRACKSDYLKPNAALLKMAHDKLNSKTNAKIPKKETKWNKLLKSANLDTDTQNQIRDLQKMLSNEIQYGTVLQTIFGILDNNKDKAFIIENELYTDLYNDIFDKHEILNILYNISNKVLDQKNLENLRKYSATEKETEYKQSIFRKNLYIKIDDKTYERKDFWPIIAKMNKIIASKNAMLLDEVMEYDEIIGENDMEGGSSNIMRLYKKYATPKAKKQV